MIARSSMTSSRISAESSRHSQPEHARQPVSGKVSTAAKAWIREHTVVYVAIGLVLGVTLGCLIKRK